MVRRNKTSRSVLCRAGRLREGCGCSPTLSGSVAQLLNQVVLEADLVDQVQVLADPVIMILVIHNELLNHGSG